MNSHVLIVLQYLVFVTLAADSASGGDRMRIVALSGDVAPGTSASTTFAGFISAPVVNNDGHTAFIGAIAGSGVNNSNRIGIWSEGGEGALSLVARTGEIAPGMGIGEQFTGWFGFGGGDTDRPVYLNNKGHIVFWSSLPNGGQGIWARAGADDLHQVVRAGNAAPGTESGVEFTGFNISEFLAFNDQDEVIFLGGLTGPSIDSSNNFGIWKSTNDGVLHLIARNGATAPGLGPGVVFNFRSFNFAVPAFNNKGSVVFKAPFMGPGVSIDSDSGIWKVTNEGGLSLQIREGDLAPGTTPGKFFSHFAEPTLNDQEQIAFVASLKESGTSLKESGTGIWVQSVEGDLEVVVLADDLALDAGPGIHFSRFGPLNGYSPMVLNKEGMVAFQAVLKGPNISPFAFHSRSLWKGRSDEGVSLVARQGDIAPGTLGAIFNEFDTFALNAKGQVAFLGSAGWHEGIWAEDTNGNLRLVAIEGQQINISDDAESPDFRTIRYLSFIAETGNSDGRKSGFNDVGQVAFRALFEEGGEGIFVWNVPEPSSIVLLLAGTVTLSVRNKRKWRKWV